MRLQRGAQPGDEDQVLAQAREPADDRLLQGAGRLQQAHGPVRRGAGEGGRLRQRRQPRPRGRLPRHAPRGRRDDRDARDRRRSSRSQSTRSFGGRVVLHGANYDEACEEAVRIQAAEGRVFVHPFDDDLGHGGAGDDRPRAARAESVPRGRRRSDRRRRPRGGRRGRHQGDEPADQGIRRRDGGASRA